VSFSWFKVFVGNSKKNTVNINLMNLPRVFVISAECPLSSDNSVVRLSFLFHWKNALE